MKTRHAATIRAAIFHAKMHYWEEQRIGIRLDPPDRSGLFLRAWYTTYNHLLLTSPPAPHWVRDLLEEFAAEAGTCCGKGCSCS